MGIRASVKQHDQDFNAELRGRLWCCIGLLDLQSAFDRGSRPLLRAQDLQVLPFDADDLESSRERSRGKESGGRIEFTDKTFSITTWRAGIAQRRLAELQASAPDTGTDPARFQKIWWERQLAVVADFEGYVTAITQTCMLQTPTISLQLFALAVARESLLAMRLQLHRPLLRSSYGLRPIRGDFNVLGAGVEVLKSADFKTSPEFAKWAWFSWLKWYALAIVLAELCSHPWDERHTRAWQTAQTSYEAYATLVADAETGLLWKPIQRLMRKASSVAQVKVRSTNVNTAAVSHGEVVDEYQQALQTTNWTAYAHTNLHLEETLNFDFPAFDDAQAVDTDPMSWIHWDMFVDDMGQSAVQATSGQP